MTQFGIQHELPPPPPRKNRRALECLVVTHWKQFLLNLLFSFSGCEQLVTTWRHKKDAGWSSLPFFFSKDFSWWAIRYCIMTLLSTTGVRYCHHLQFAGLNPGPYRLGWLKEKNASAMNWIWIINLESGCRRPVWDVTLYWLACFKSMSTQLNACIYIIFPASMAITARQANAARSDCRGCRARFLKCKTFCHGRHGANAKPSWP